VQKFLNFLISGTVTGGIYALMASGLVLTYETSGVFNFSHGAVAFVTAYFYYQLHTGGGIPIVPAAVISVLFFAPALGLLLDKLMLQRLSTAPVYARIVGTIGLLVALPQLALWLVETVADDVFGASLPKLADIGAGGTAPGLGPFPPTVFRFGWLGLPTVHLNSDQLAVFGAAAIAAGVLWFIVRRTRAGLEMRAAVDRESLASLRGINRKRTSALAWVLTMLLAGVGGILIAPLFQLQPDFMTLIVFGSLSAVVLSGLRSIPIAFVGGLALGVVQDLVAGYGDSFLPHFLNNLSGFRSAIPFILTLALVFLIREAPSEEAPQPDHRVGVPAWRRRLPWIVFTIVLLGFALQWTGVPALQADTYEQGIIAQGIVFGIIFLSFVVVTGLGGMVSLAQASFVVAGGFAAGWALDRNWGLNLPLVATHGHLNFAIAALIGALAGAGLGLFVAVIVAWRRLGAVALAIATFALAFFLSLVPFDTQVIAHGNVGYTIPSPSLSIPGINWLNRQLVSGAGGHLDFSDPAEEVVLLLALFGLVTLLVYWLQRSASGRAMLAARSSEVAARTSGLSPSRTRLMIFAVSAGIAGFGGVLFAMTTNAASAGNAPPLIGLIWLAVAVVFGVRRPGGALLAGLAFACTPLIFQWIGHDFLNTTFGGALSGHVGDLTTASYFAPILFGLGAINLAQNPDGLLALVGQQRLARRQRRERKAEAAAAAAAAQALPAAVTPAATASPTPDGGGGAPASLALTAVVAGYGAGEVLHGIDLAVPAGRVMALLGANGAGKSTLCNVASGLLAPTGGQVRLEGRDVTGVPADERARQGLLLVPEARGIFPGLTVEENLRVLLRTPAERDQAYERFPILAERRRQRAGLMSGGEQQMLSLAPALAQPPKVLIADEPTLGLAPLASQEVLRALEELRSLGTAILLVEEKAHEVLGIADRVAFMELGRVVWEGPRAEADEQRLSAAYLGAKL
jgi:ABC-type branched-subunit amino acid transport system ATPase component/branched-subunit amino acid ABC-type transport system permease component